MIETLKNNQKLVKEVFSKFLDSKSHRKTPERFSILKEIYDSNDHFDIDTLHAKMSNKNYKISKATLYNTIELLLECSLVRKHQFSNDHQASYEKCYFNKQHDHLIISDSDEVIEFCDPRINTIKETIEEVFDVTIDSHSLYFYGKKNNTK